MSIELVAENDLLNIAVQLGRNAQSKDDVLQILASIQTPWLLILDNADNLGVEYSVYFPSGSYGVVMLASRNGECRVHATTTEICLPLGPLTEAEAQTLLLKTAHISSPDHQMHEESIKIVISLLDCHPLALIMAGTYIAQRQCSVEEYHKTFTKQRRRILEFRTVQTASRYGSVFATLEASATGLKSSSEQASEDALDLLHLISMCSTVPLPLSLFTKAWSSCQRVIWNSMYSEIREDNDDLRFLAPWHVD